MRHALFALLLAAPAVASAQTALAPSEVSARADSGATPKAWTVSAAVQYRQQAVVDVDPENERLMVYKLGGSARLFDGAKGFVRFGLLERFVAQPGESGFRLQDAQVGMTYAHRVALGTKQLDLVHDLAVFLPTSRPSLTQHLYAAPQYLLTASVEVLPDLVLSAAPNFRYRFHRYAERSGFGAGMNTQWEAGAHGGLDYTFWKTGLVGDLSLGASGGSTWYRKFDSRDDHDSATSDQGFVQQLYDWEAHVAWQFLPRLGLTVSLEQGGPVLRDGIVNTFFVQRDETELAFTLAGAY
jgi:hypothetical protein